MTPTTPAEDAYLDAEAEHAFAPFAGRIPAGAAAMMRLAFVLVAGTDPGTVERRRRAHPAGLVQRSGVQVNAADGAPDAEEEAG